VDLSPLAAGSLFLASLFAGAIGGGSR